MYGVDKWRLDWFVMNEPQANYHAILQTEEGFWSSPGVRSTKTDRTNAHGIVLSSVWKGERAITLEGRAYAADDPAVKRLARALKALCSDPNRDYTLTCESSIGTFTTQVRLDGPVLVDSGDDFSSSITWSIQVVASDPRLYAPELQTQRITLPQNTEGGLDFKDSVAWDGDPPNPNEYGLDFAAYNLFQNPTFDVNASWWWPLNENEDLDTLDTPGPQDNRSVGNRALRVTATESGGFGFESPSQPIQEGQTAFTFSGYFRAPTAQTLNIYAVWLDETDSYISEGAGTVTLPAGEWVWASVTTIAKPSNAAYWRFVVRQPTGEDGDYFDATGLLAEVGTEATRGFDFRDSGLHGLSFGVDAHQTGGGVLRSSGSAPTPIKLTLVGPLDTPVITNNVTGQTIRYNDSLTDGEMLVIEPSKPSVLLGGTANRRHLVDPANFRGLEIPPANDITGERGELTLGLSHSGPVDAGGYLIAEWRDASW